MSSEDSYRKGVGQGAISSQSKLKKETKHL